MPGAIWNIEFLNQNSQRSYPLSEKASKQDKTGTLTLPRSFLLGLRLSVDVGLSVEPGRFYLHSVTISPVGYNIAVGYDDDSADGLVVATTNVGKSTHSEYDVYGLVGKGNFLGCNGDVVVGKLDEIDEIGPGQYFFTPAAGQLDPDAIVPMIAGIPSIIVQNGVDVSDPLVGDIVLRAGTNIRIDVETSPVPTITINAISGEGLNTDCDCDDLAVSPCIRRINGVGPDPDGNVELGGDDCIQVIPHADQHLLELADRCSKPCCGCPELDAIQAQLDLFGDAKVTLTGIANRVEANTTQLSLIVIGSKIGDSGCSEC